MSLNPNRASNAPSQEFAGVLQPRYTAVWKGTQNALHAVFQQDAYAMREADSEMAPVSKEEMVARVKNAQSVEPAASLASLALDAEVEAQKVFEQTEPDFLHQETRPMSDEMLDSMEASPAPSSQLNNLGTLDDYELAR